MARQIRVGWYGSPTDDQQRAIHDPTRGSGRGRECNNGFKVL